MGFVRNVEFQVKTGKSPEFLKLFTSDVLPMLKQSPGFEHELAMTNGDHAVGISIWRDKSSAENYQAKVYPEILKKLNPLLDGAPRVQSYELSLSTLIA